MNAFIHPNIQPLINPEQIPPLGLMPYTWALERGDFTTDEVTRAATAWTNISRSASNDLKLKAIIEKMNDIEWMRAIVPRNVGKDDLTVLRLFRRHHGYLDATAMSLELVARGLSRSSSLEYPTAKNPPPALKSLISKLAIRSVMRSGQSIYERPMGYVCHTSCWSAVEPLPSLRATVDLRGEEPKSGTAARSPVEFLMDLQAFDAELARMNRWTRTAGRLLPPPIIKRLTKALPGQTRLFHLFSDILGFAGMIDIANRQEATYTAELNRSPMVADPLLAMHRCVHGWMMGVFADETDPVTSRNLSFVSSGSETLWHVRSLTVWGLQAAANTTDGWINSRTWLEWLFSILGIRTPSVYSVSPDWKPQFAGYHRPPSGRNDDDAVRNTWMQTTGRMIVGALHHVLAPMGLVECGPIDVVDPVFRFTPFGRAFFARPDLPFPKSATQTDDKPIVVQSNFEIVAPLAAMSPHDAMTLSKFAKLTSAPGSPVQTFAISDETIFRGLDSGLTIAGIQEFLTQRGKTPVPANVERMLATWAANRERLVYSERVTVTIQPDGQYAVVPATTKNAVPAIGTGREEWTIGPDLRVAPTAKASELSKTILRRIAETGDGTTFRLTKGSIAVPIARGVTGSQIETWLQTYAGPTYRQHAGLALKNWLNPGSCSLTPMILFAPPMWADEFLEGDETFQSFVVDVIDDGFLIDASRRSEFEAYLVRHGFDVAEAPLKKKRASKPIRYAAEPDDDDEPLPRIGQKLSMAQLQSMFGQLIGGLPRR